MEFPEPSRTPVYLNHGYDESKPLEQLGLNDMKEAAEFRGGACLDYTAGDFYRPVRWRCAFGHEFEASPNLILREGTGARSASAMLGIMEPSPPAAPSSTKCGLRCTTSLNPFHP